MTTPCWSVQAALRLVKQGVEVVEGDLTDKASVDRAFDGVDYVFASTMSEYDGTEVSWVVPCASDR